MDLQALWFFLWGLLWAVFFMTDGFDFGVGALLPFLGRTNDEKRIMIKTLGPLWDGNEVWLITAGGVTFAAFPLVYAVMFSSLYSALMLILFALIIRGVSFEFRSKVDHPVWRQLWDTCIFIGSLFPALLFGVAFANIFKGLPINRNGIYEGVLFDLLNPYGLLGGVLFLLLFLTHGSLWLSLKTDGELRDRSIKTAHSLWFFLLAAAVAFLIASKFSTRLYDNYTANPVLFIFIFVTVIALAAIKYFLAKQAFFQAWVCSCATIIGATFFGIIGLYPNMILSSINPEFSLSAHNASSSPLTLKIMLGVVVIFLPVVIAYQIWAYFLFRDKVTLDDLAYDESY